MKKQATRPRRRRAPKLLPPAGLQSFRIGADPRVALLEWPSRAAAPPGGALSPAESSVLDLLCEGLSNAEIAARRGRSPRTVARQVSSIFAKLGVSGRPELFARVACPRAQGGHR